LVLTAFQLQTSTDAVKMAVKPKKKKHTNTFIFLTIDKLYD